MLEAQDTLGGNHTWCLHASDVGHKPWQSSWIAPLISKSWPGYRVQFTKFSRSVSGDYLAIRSMRFDAELRTLLSDRVRTGSKVVEVQPRCVRLANGDVIAAEVVIDGRGWPAEEKGGPFAYQKFLGQYVQLKEPHKLDVPLLMDARVAQTDGFRFVYTLPFDDRTLLVEETYYSLNPNLDPSKIRSNLSEYLERHGFKVDHLRSEESGILPLPLLGMAQPASSIRSSGMAAGLFHATTGYSIVQAMRFAEWLGRAWGNAALDQQIRQYSQRHWRRQRFYRRLNNMLFLVPAASERYKIIENFYRHDPALIARFYAGTTSLVDQWKILSKPPPISYLKALRKFVMPSRIKGVQA